MHQFLPIVVKGFSCAFTDRGTSDSDDLSVSLRMEKFRSLGPGGREVVPSSPRIATKTLGPPTGRLGCGFSSMREFFLTVGLRYCH